MDELDHANAWQAARRILAIRLDNMGDVLMTTPALRALRGTQPDRHITLLTSRSGAAVAPFLPEVDEVIVHNAAGWLPSSADSAQADLDTIATLRDGQFDAAVIFTVYSQNPLPAAMMCWLAGIPLRLAHCRENPYHLLTDWVRDPEPHELIRHEARRQLDLVAAVGCTARDERLSFQVPAADRTQAMSILRNAGIDPTRPWIVIHPGATAASRRYPVEHFASVTETLLQAGEPQLVFTGDASEAALIDDIRSRLSQPVPSVAGELSLGELGAVISAATLLIANNTGPVHMAAALGTPVVDLYALTNPQHGPWQVASRVLYHDVPCRFCYRSVCPQSHHQCLRLLDPARVAQAARELLAEGKDRSAPPLLGTAPAATADTGLAPQV